MAPLLDSSLKTSLSLSPSAKIEKYGGGGFASTFKIRDTDSSGNEHCYFVKIGEGDQADVMFTGEHTSLNALHAISNTLAPRSYAHGVLASSPTSHFLATQFLTLRPASSPSSLARKLALLHSTPAPTPPGYKTPQFGFPVSTCCGRTVQCNAYSASWSAFYASNRLRPILDLCLKTQGPDPELQTRGRDVTVVVVPRLLRDGHLTAADGGPVVPVLVHGDLWAGNWGLVDMKGSGGGRGEGGGGGGGDEEEMVFDPCCVYAHREYEAGIMRMFGGFGAGFWEIYDGELEGRGGLDEPKSEREDRGALYELYHHLNHYAMFGGSYRSGAVRIMERLLKKYGDGSM